MMAAQSIAEKIDDSRELEGALLKLLSLSLSTTDSNKITAESAFHELSRQEEQRKVKVSPQDVIRAVATFYELKPAHIRGLSLIHIYQQLLSQAMSEFQAINQAIQSGQKVGPVKKGDAIALVGNSGFPKCSTGKHLHFEVRRDGKWVDPGEFLGKEWQWPLSEPITLTQSFGVTPYSAIYAYSGGIHTGYDMVSNGSDVIRAVADGTLYSSNQSCSGSIINIRYIEHGNGLMSFYLHVQ